MIADYEGDISELLNVKVDGDCPILATRNMVLFPGVITPILIGRKSSRNLINKLQNAEGTVFAVMCQKRADTDNPSFDDLYHTGVFARLVRVLEIPGPGNNVTAIVQALGRCTLVDITKTKPDGQMRAHR